MTAPSRNLEDTVKHRIKSSALAPLITFRDRNVAAPPKGRAYSSIKVNELLVRRATILYGWSSKIFGLPRTRYLLICRYFHRHVSSGTTRGVKTPYDEFFSGCLVVLFFCAGGAAPGWGGNTGMFDQLG